jgi:proteasome accessory factor C
VGLQRLSERIAVLFFTLQPYAFSLKPLPEAGTMDRLRKVLELTKCFMEANERSPEYLMKRIECSRFTIYRTVKMAQVEFSMPLVFDTKKKVWRLEESKDQVKFPYIWFSPKEVLVLLALLETFREFPFGIVDAEIGPFKSKLEQLINSEKGEMGQLLKKIRIIPIAFRKINHESLAIICEALARGKKMEVSYKDRQKEERSDRVISPIQLIRYKDNWYLDAYCHKRDSLRTFSLDRIERAKIVEEKAKSVNKKDLQKLFSESYGIFSGKPKARAVLKFSPTVARWVSCENWHPKQEASYEKDGSYILKIPYSDERELVLDIMRYGDEVEVLEPETLRKAVRKKLQKALGKYK